MRLVTFRTQTAKLGLLVLALAVAALLFWVPNDTLSGFVQSRRGRVSIGDAMAPGLAFGLMALSGALLLSGAAREPLARGLDRQGAAYLGFLVGTLALSFLIMRFAGPVIAQLFAADGDYRVLRDTAPWKYLGFVLGGGGLVAILVSYMERKATWKAVLIGLAAALALIGALDLVFDDLLLPPNGDV